MPNRAMVCFPGVVLPGRNVPRILLEMATVRGHGFLRNLYDPVGILEL